MCKEQISRTHIQSTKIESQTQAKIEAKTETERPFRWKSVLCPILAGCFHLHVFYEAIHFIYASFTLDTDLLTPDDVANLLYRVDHAAFVAYSFDLICCYALGVIPFSRCNSASDIAGHHLPILCLVLPLCIPIWAQLESLDPLFFAVIHSNNSKARSGLIIACLRATGLGFVSSLNEVFMCFQRAEMSWAGIFKFSDIPHMNINMNINRISNRGHGNHTSQIPIRIFTSRFMIGVELYFKFCIFCIFSLFGFKACCNVDLSYLAYILDPEISPASEVASKSIWNIARLIYASPNTIRAGIFRLFMLAMYPSMGMRTAKKIRAFHRNNGTRMIDGGGGGNRKIA
jgi:hypothetical protein